MGSAAAEPERIAIAAAAALSTAKGERMLKRGGGEGGGKRKRSRRLDECQRREGGRGQNILKGERRGVDRAEERENR